MGTKVFDPSYSNSSLTHQPVEVSRLTFSGEAFEVAPRVGRVDFVDVAGLAIFERAERGESRRWLMIVIRDPRTKTLKPPSSKAW